MSRSLRFRPGRFIAAILVVLTTATVLIPTSSPASATVLSPATSVAAGKEFACALTPTNTVVCWGSNSDDQLNVPSGTFVDVAAGRYDACALTAGQSILCWGSNLAPFDPYVTNQAVPPRGATFAAVTAGAFFNCALGIDGVGAIVCWGSDTFGQLNAPAGVFTEISAGGNTTIAKRADGVVVAWGENAAGQTVVPDSVQPVSPSPDPEPGPTPPHFTG